MRRASPVTDMPRAARLWMPNGIVHVDARAYGGAPIFALDEDRAFLVEFAARVFDESGIECLGWSVPINHYHFLLRCPDRPGPAMHRINTAVAMRHRRLAGGSGAVFQGRFYSGICEDDASLRMRLAYVSANPLRHRVVPDVESLAAYPWCSVGEVLGLSEPRLVSPSSVLEILDPSGDATRARRCFLELIESRARAWAGAGGTDADERGDLPTTLQLPRRVTDAVRTPHSLGSVSGRLPAPIAESDDPAVRRHVLRSEGWSPDRLVDVVRATLEIRVRDVRTARRTSALSDLRAIVSHVACDGLGWPTVEIAGALGVSGPGVSRARERGPAALRAAGLTVDGLLRASLGASAVRPN